MQKDVVCILDTELLWRNRCVRNINLNFERNWRQERASIYKINMVAAVIYVFIVIYLFTLFFTNVAIGNC